MVVVWFPQPVNIQVSHDVWKTQQATVFANQSENHTQQGFGEMSNYLVIHPDWQHPDYPVHIGHFWEAEPLDTMTQVCCWQLFSPFWTEYLLRQTECSDCTEWTQYVDWSELV